MGLFTSGYKAVRKEQKRQEEYRKNLKGKLFHFFLTEKNDEANIVFLNNEPVNFYGHNVQNKDRYDLKVCTDKDCKFCADGDKPSFKGAFLIYDKTPFEYTDRESGKKKKGKGSVKLYIAGTRVLGMLDRLNEKYGLTSYEWTISRTGTKTSTVYAFDRGDELDDRDSEDISNLLPEELQDSFNPDSDDEDDIEEAVQELVQGQLEKLIDKDDEEEGEDDGLSEDDDEEEEREEKRTKKHHKKGVQGKEKVLSKKHHSRVDDDEDEEDDDEISDGDEDDEEEAPKKKHSVRSLLKKHRK